MLSSRGLKFVGSAFSGQRRWIGSGRADLYAKRSVLGKIANEAEVGRLIFSRLSINQNFESNFVALEEVYSGSLTIAEDRVCMAVE